MSGILHPSFQRVRNDDMLTLKICSGYIDIYNRGGRLLGIYSRAKDMESIRSKGHPHEESAS